MSGARRFSVSTPDWGQAHLSLDAIVAYVDDELAPGAHARADAHLADCRECTAEVTAQRQARAALRGAGGPCLPSSLLRSLRAIPVDAELPPVPPGLAVSADGEFVLLRDVPAPDADPGAPTRHHAAAPRRLGRRARIGAVSGLALGALAVGALVAPDPVPPAPERGVLGGGAVLNVPVQARLGPAGPHDGPPTVTSSPAPVAEPTLIDVGLRERLDRLPAAFHPAGNP